MDLKVHTGDTPAVSIHRHAHKQTLKRIKSEVILGSPGMDCQGVGVCRVMAYGEPFEGKCPVITAWMSVTAERKLRFSFWKSTIERRTMKRHFGWLLFQVYELYELPAELTRPLTKEPVKVYPGIYPVWETSRFLIVDF